MPSSTFARRGFAIGCTTCAAHFGGRELFSVGEYWSQDVADLHRYLRASEEVMSLFDVPLHYRFHRASQRVVFI